MHYQHSQIFRNMAAPNNPGSSSQLSMVYSTVASYGGEKFTPDEPSFLDLDENSDKKAMEESSLEDEMPILKEEEIERMEELARGAQEAVLKNSRLSKIPDTIKELYTGGYPFAQIW